MPIDPDIQSMLDQMNAAGFPHPGHMSAAEMRAIFEGMGGAMPVGPEMALVQDHIIDTTTPIMARLYIPKEEVRAALLHLHGGGWTLGSVESSDFASRTYAQRLRCAVLSVDYRLAPEHPFPAAVEDSYAALLWAADNLPHLIGRDLPLLVGGDSAGGNLSAVMCQLARDRDGPAIAAQILINPATDGDMEAPSLSAFESPFLTLDEIKWFYDQYVPDPDCRMDPRMAPIRAESLEGLPPAFVLTCEYDLLRGEGEAYASRLALSGVATVLKRYPGTTHSFLPQNPGLKRSRDAFADIDSFITGFVSG